MFNLFSHRDDFSPVVGKNVKFSDARKSTPFIHTSINLEKNFGNLYFMDPLHMITVLKKSWTSIFLTTTIVWFWHSAIIGEANILAEFIFNYQINIGSVDNFS